MLFLHLLCASVPTFVYSVCAHSTPRALAYVNAQPPWHGVIKRTIEGSPARRWPPSLQPPPLLRAAATTVVGPVYCCCEIIVVLFLLLLCACSRTYGASSREKGERHTSCDIPRSLLVQLRLLRMLRVLLRTAAAAAAVAAAAAAAAVCFADAASASTYCRRRRRRC